MRKVFTWIAGMTVCLFLFSGCSVYESVISTGSTVKPEEYYEVSEGEAAVFADNVQMDMPAVCRDGIYYLSADSVRNVDSRFYWDGSDENLFFTNAETIYKEPVANREMALIEDGQLYLSLACLEKYADVQISLFDNPDRIYIDTAHRERTLVPVKKDTKLRIRGGLRSAVVSDVKKGTTVELLDAMENWAEVRTEDGNIGYMQLKYMDRDSAETVEVISNHEEPDYTGISLDEKVCLVWQDMENRSGNTQFSYLIDGTQGINVVSPSWFALQDNEGNYRNLASESYVKEAHDLGIDVWVRVDDFNRNMSIEQVLGKNAVRQRLVSNLVADVKAVNADGINVDFEFISDASGDAFSQFLRELRFACHKEGLILSVDNANPTYLRHCYDLKEQGRVADYVILMGYDEHWKGSAAGSVSSISYVTEGIEIALQYVPAEKLISGLPFYARVWREIPEEDAEPGAELREDGDSEYEVYSLDSVALSMKEIAEIVRESGQEPEWNETIGQYYVEIPKEKGKQRIWIEDERSLKLKLDAVSAHSLAGIAFWKLGMEDQVVWTSVIADYLK